MYINEYNPDNMTLKSESISGVDFGVVLRGSHVEKPVVIKPIIQDNEPINRLELFLENNGGLVNTQFGVYKNRDSVTGIGAGSPYISDHLDVVTGVTGFDSRSANKGVSIDPINPEFIWLDAQIGFGETTGDNESINFRFVFEYD